MSLFKAATNRRFIEPQRAQREEKHIPFRRKFRDLESLTKFRFFSYNPPIN